MHRWKLLAVLTLPFVVGCFPIELDVNKDGQILIARQEGFFIFDPAAGKTTKVLGAEGDQPVFARFSPNGKDMLAVTKLARGFNEFRFVVAPLEGGEGRQVYKGQNTGYVRYAPDGDSLVISRIPDRQDPKLKSQVPELVLIHVKDGTAKVLARRTGVLFRWFGDSQRLLIFEIARKDKNEHFFGNVAVLDASTGKSTSLAAAVVTQQFFFDLSPDNKKALFTALRAGKAGANLEKGNEYKMTLFEVDVAEGSVRKTGVEARYAIYSPNGKKVLLGTPPAGFDFTSLKLEVADADLGNSRVIAAHAHMPLTLGGEGVMFPGWVNDKTIYYFVSKAVYGTEGKSVALMVVGANGRGKKCVQPLIDLDVLKAEK